MHMAFLSRVFKNLQWYGMTVKSLDFQGFFLFPRNPNPAPKSHLVLFGCWGGFFALMPLLVVEVCAWPSLLEAVFTS